MDTLYGNIDEQEFILKDPVQFPHRFRSRKDIEIAAFLSAALAWGRRNLIIRSCEAMFGLMKSGPTQFVMAGDYRKLEDRCVHRTFFGKDLKYFCQGFRFCYEKYDNLESLFASTANVWDGMALFRKTMAQGNAGLFSKHIADPASSSACKRLNLALRWLVREGPVDLGLWKRISPASLFVPLDIHVGRAARQLGLLDPLRKANDKKAVIALTEKLREFCPEDPIKYDLVLFKMGISEARPFI
jgi:uncharacterized protein (TIGR02757 family)